MSKEIIYHKRSEGFEVSPVHGFYDCDLYRSSGISVDDDDWSFHEVDEETYFMLRKEVTKANSPMAFSKRGGGILIKLIDGHKLNIVKYYTMHEGRGFLRKDHNEDSIILNLKTGWMYTRWASFNRVGYKKRGSWDRHLVKCNFNKMMNIARDIGKVDKEFIKIISKYIPWKRSLVTTIKHWFCNFHGIEPPKHNKYLRLYPKKENFEKYPDWITATLKRAGIYSHRVRAMASHRYEIMKKFVLISTIIKAPYFYEIAKLLAGYDNEKIIPYGYQLNDVKINPISDGPPDKKTQRNIMMVMRDAMKKQRLEISEISDHLRMISDLNELGIKKEWRSETLESFQREHFELTVECDMLRRGKYDIHFEPDMVKNIESFSYNGYYAKLLKTTEDYIRESRHQRNCVSSYIERVKRCFIVSLRKGTEHITTSVKYNNEINQIKARMNDPAPRELKKAFQAYIKGIELKIPEIKFETADTSNDCYGNWLES